MKKLIDGRGLPCPQPLILTKKAVDAEEADIIEVIVDNEAGRENIIKYAKHVKIEIIDLHEHEGEIHLILDAKAHSPQEQKEMEDAPAPECLTEEASSPGSKTIFIRTDTIGTANRELGELLMRGFLYTLTEREEKPETIIFMNDGVRLAVKGSQSVENIKTLINEGVKILVCGTCLDYLHLTEDLEAGTISNMYDITETLMNAEETITL